jgi:hypothetical protein
MKVSALVSILALASAPLAAAEWAPAATPDVLAAIAAPVPAAPAKVSPRDGQNYSGAEEMLIMEFDLPGIGLDIPEAEVIRQLQMYPSQVTFENALRQALGSFLNDYTDPTGPLARTLKAMGSANGQPSKTELAKARGQLRARLNADGAFLALVQPYRAFQPRNGEKVEQNWVFFLRLSDGYYWAVVDRAGTKAAYSYGIN